MGNQYKSLDKNLIFAEYFNSEQEVRRNGGVPVNSPVVANGQLEEVETNGWYRYWMNINSPLSIRAKVTFREPPSTRRIVDGRYGGGNLEAQYNAGKTLNSTTPYVNGVQTNSFDSWGVEYDVVWVFANIQTAQYIDIGGQYNDATSTVDISLVEIYNKALTQEEVSNLYNDARYVMPVLEHEAQGDGTDLNVSSCENSGSTPYTTFTSASATGFAAVGDGVGIQICGTADEIVLTDGARVIVEFDLVLNSGTAPNYGITVSLGTASSRAYEGNQTSTEGHNSFVFTSDYLGTGTIAFYNNAATNYTISNLSVQNLAVEPTSKILHVTARYGVARNLLSGDVIGSNLAPKEDWILGTGVSVDANGNYVFTDDGSNSDLTIVNISGVKANSTYQFIINTIATDNPSNNFRIVAGATNIPATGDRNTDDDGNSLKDVGTHVVTLTNTTGDDVIIRLNSGAGTGDTVTISFISLKLVIPEPTLTDVEVVKDGQIRVPRFNGGTSKISLNDTLTLSNGSSYTINFWAKQTLKTAAVYFGVLGNSGMSAYNMIAFREGELYIESSVNGDNEKGTLIYDDFEWHCYSVKINSDGTIDMYQDGISLTMDGNTIDDDIVYNQIGGLGDLVAYKGDISEVIVIDGLLTAEKISQYYTATKHLYGK